MKVINNDGVMREIRVWITAAAAVAEAPVADGFLGCFM